MKDVKKDDHPFSEECCGTSASMINHICHILCIIYSKEVAHGLRPRLKDLMDRYSKNEVILTKREKYKDRPTATEKDAILITYADTLFRDGEAPLRTLARFLEEHVDDAVSIIHLLPFYPYSSDGGYSVIDFKAVDPRLGSWKDVRHLAKNYRLMFDFVMNHVSSRSPWFQGFLAGDKQYRDYFLWYDKQIDMPKVFRPREHPLLTEFDTEWGKKYVWTTFSEDQIDLNYRNPEVLLKTIEVFLFYLSNGAELVRLDAVGYMWKEPNTSCVNLSKTHQLVKLLRAVLEYTAPYAMIVAEANFPYEENLSYYGEGHEAAMVYRFDLPPLVMDAFARKDTSYIVRERSRLRQDLLFMNFLASHDGIGLPAAKEILKKTDLEHLLATTKKHGGRISYKKQKGVKSPYELNINYFDAINNPSTDPDPLAVERFLASQAVMLSLQGIPGIYIHSLLGSRNDYRGVEETGINRNINREKLHADKVLASLADRESLRYRVLNAYIKLLKFRGRLPAFRPRGLRAMIGYDDRLFSVERCVKGEIIRVLVNVTDETIPLPEYESKFDKLRETPFDGNVEPYGIYFLDMTGVKTG